VPVCLDPRARLMRGVGDVLSRPLTLPPLPAVLVNPGAALATRTVFAGWKPVAAPSTLFDPAALAKATSGEQFLQLLIGQPNDLQDAAVALAPVIAEVLDVLRSLAGCRLARMSGSGSTCFALFLSSREAAAAADVLRGKYPHWWVKRCKLGDAA